jgi:hypothetical protein
MLSQSVLSLIRFTLKCLRDLAFAVSGKGSLTLLKHFLIRLSMQYDFGTVYELECESTEPDRLKALL